MASLDFIYDLKDKLQSKGFEFIIVASQTDNKDNKSCSKVLYKVHNIEIFECFKEIKSDAQGDILSGVWGSSKDKKHWTHYYAKMLRKQGFDFFVFAIKVNNVRDTLILLFNADSPKRAVLLVNSLAEAEKELEKEFSSPS